MFKIFPEIFPAAESAVRFKCILDVYSPLFLVLNLWPVSTGFCGLPELIKVLNAIKVKLVTSSSVYRIVTKSWFKGIEMLTKSVFCSEKLGL